MLYKDLNSGIIYTEKEVREAYEMYAEEMVYESFEDYMSQMLAEGQQKIGGYIDLTDAVKTLYNHIDMDTDSIQADMDHDYLTQNEGRNGREYLWYMDNETCAAIDLETHDIHDDEEFFEEQFC